MYQSHIQKLTFEEFSKMKALNQLSYEQLFDVININEDTEVCKLARHTLYNSIAIDFLNNYLLDDFFDKDKGQSRDIFELMVSLFTDHKDVTAVLLRHINTGQNDSRVVLAWDILSQYALTIEQLSSIICNSQVKSIRKQAWNILESELSNINDDLTKEIIIKIFNNCTDKELEFECWNLLWESDFFEDETDIELILNNEHSKIVEYVWKRIDYEKLSAEKLLQIATDTSSEKVAKESLVLYRNKV